MTQNVYVTTNSLGVITGVLYSPQTGFGALTETPLDNPDVQAFLNPPVPSPALKKWQLWLTALQLSPPVTKSDVYGAIFTLDLTEVQKEAIRIMIEDVTEYHREDPRIGLLATAMGLNATEMDSLWAWAAMMDVPDLGA